MAFVVAAIWKAKPGEDQRILEVIKTITPLSRAEPKCLFYQAQLSPDDPATFFLYEQYADAQGYEDHKASEHFQRRVLGHAINYLSDRQVSTYETIDVLSGAFPAWPRLRAAAVAAPARRGRLASRRCPGH